MMTIQEIYEYLSRFFTPVELIGNGEELIHAPAKIESAQAGEVTFVANKKYLRFLALTEASLVIVERSLAVEEYVGKHSFLKVNDPYSAFVFLLQRFIPPRRIAKQGIAATASIGSNVTIGENVSIGEYAVIGEHCSIGNNTVIAAHSVLLDHVTIGSDVVLFPHVTCYDGTRIGNRVVIHSGAVIGADGFGFAPQQDGSYIKIPQIGIVEIGDDVEIGANTTIDRATLGSTVIESGVKLDNLVQVAHNCRIGAHTVIAAQAGVSGSTTLGNHCIVGGQVGFAGHIEVSDHIQVAAKAGVSKSFMQSGIALRGYPAQPMREQLKYEAQLRTVGDLHAKLKALEQELKALRGSEMPLQNTL
uniref:UDP-3-O-acylglucosamine N-acyltransferase n=1 Tax=Chlorobium chlorochromatii (strain CaD3) TaxID=340177 RepID=LPXD_CHLCH|nr:RecName: Full=UDP-3-O-acylglucosamine N-acyltransferase [Chlorobium chlorochromatii CaD3]